MRIDVITVITGLSDQAIEMRRSALQQFASEGTDVRLVVTGAGPSSVESEVELELAAPGILKAVVEATDDGTDGIVIWGGHDPSLSAAREMVDVPVIGPGMASMLLASSLVHRFSLLIQLENVRGIAERQVRALGLDGRCGSIRSVGVPVLELANDEAFPDMQHEALLAVDEDGADGICFGCMAMTPHAPELQRWLTEQRPGTIVIDPGLAAVRWLEMIIHMGLCHSRRSFPSPPKPVLW